MYEEQNPGLTAQTYQMPPLSNSTMNRPYIPNQQIQYPRYMQNFPQQPNQQMLMANQPNQQMFMANQSNQQIFMGNQPNQQIFTPIYQAPMFQPIINQMTAITSSIPTYRTNQQLFCPFCKSIVFTNIVFEPGAGTWIMCLLLGICIGLFGFIVFCIDDCKDCIHICSRCGNRLGTVKYMIDN